jgi:hypothetical protein
MGGTACASDIDDDLTADDVGKSEKKSLFQKLAKAFGYEVVEKGAMADNFKRRVKDDNFYTAWYALRDTLEGYTYDENTNSYVWGYTNDEEKIREALEDFNQIVTNILAGDSVVKSLSKAAKEQSVKKAGKSISSKNLETLTGICNSLSEFVASFNPDDTAEDDSGNGDVAKNSENISTNPKKEEKEMKKSEVQALVEESITKAMEPITAQLEAIAKGEDADGSTGAEGGGSTQAPTDGEASPEDVSTAVADAVAKAMEPINAQLEAIRKSRALPSNLNDAPSDDVKKSEGEHYLHGII